MCTIQEIVVLCTTTPQYMYSYVPYVNIWRRCGRQQFFLSLKNRDTYLSLFARAFCTELETLLRGRVVVVQVWAAHAMGQLCRMVVRK